MKTDALKMDVAGEIDRIVSTVRRQIFKILKRRGAVLGISGGIDSSVAAILAVKALGKERVLGLLMPEEESSADSLRMGRLIADHLGLKTVLEDVTPILKAAGCYQRRDDAIRKVIPEYGPGYQCKIALPDFRRRDGYKIFSVVVRSPEGEEIRARLTAAAYLGIVAATNFKQRTRKMMEYHHADRLHYAVLGTTNRVEYDQGFFVKNGDGSADLYPIAHLYKTQVYQMAEYLGVPEEIRTRPPTTDTYSLQQSQEEFYFTMPYDKMDLCLHGKNHKIVEEDISAATGLAADEIRRVYRDIESTRRATRYLHLRSLFVEKIDEIEC
jgi:NAD+ synthase